MDPASCVQIGYVNVRSLSGGADYSDVPPNFALPFKDWLARVFRVHGQSTSVRRAIVAGCKAQALVDGTSAQAVWRSAWAYDRDHEGPEPDYPEQIVVVRSDASRAIRKPRLAYRLHSVIR